MPRRSQPPVVEAPLFFLDYDGTLAPIVEDPSEAYPHPEVPPLLRALAAHHPVWIVTGRHLRDIERFLPGHPLPAIGRHGTQQGTLGGTVENLTPDEAAEAARQMREALPVIEGVEVENKGSAFAVHYRAAPDETDARDRLRSWTDDLPDALEAIWGKKVVELRPKHLSKGTAVRRVLGQYPGKTPVYLGDDTTDEDAFEELLKRNDAVTVRVGGGQTAARYRLADPEAVVAYLQRYTAD